MVAAAAIVWLVRHFHIDGFKTIEPEVLYASAQPRGMDYSRLLYGYHIGGIVNLRSPAEHRDRNWYHEEIMWVRSNGVRYFELPVERGALPDEQTQREFLAIMANKENLPVLLHDSNGRDRVSMLAGVWLIKGKGGDTGEVARAIERIKGQALSESEKDFILNLNK